MAAGKKTETIIIQESSKIVSEFNSIQEIFTNKMKIKAEVKFSSNFLGLSGYELIQSDKIIFQIYKRNINYTDRILYKGITYLITSLSIIGYNKNEIEIIAEKIK